MATPNDAKPKKILIVEDEADVLEVEKKILETKGYNVITADTGQKALDIIQNEELDLVLLDIMLPDIDGFSVFKNIKTDEATRNLPILVITGRSSMSDTFLAMGADGFISKPIENNSLLAEVENISSNKALVIADTPPLITTITEALQKNGYSAEFAKDDADMINVGQKAKYKCVIAHLACVNSSPEELKTSVAANLNYKDPTLILYSDSSVKGLETKDTVPINDEQTKWIRSGVKLFYDSRINLKKFPAVLKDWLPED